MPGLRICSNASCQNHASYTLTYVHADACVVIGPLATRAEPGAHDLCDYHSSRLKAPQGWELIRIGVEEGAPERSRDDLLAIADAVREAGTRRPEPAGARHGHLRVIGNPEE